MAEDRKKTILSMSSQAMSPDGESIVTGAGDETLRFWNVFNKTRSTKVSCSDLSDTSVQSGVFLFTHVK